jgi:RNA polymerase sigma-70 factor, ECF subfamily
VRQTASASIFVSETVSCSDLLSRVANGDRAAFRVLYDTTGRRLFAICQRMMSSRSEAEDVLQDAFVKIWEKSWQFDPEKGNGLSWLAAVTRHCALDRLRSRKAGHVRLDDAIDDIDREIPVSVAHAGESLDLDRCLGGLREDYRNAVVLAYVRGLSHEELAAQLDKPLGTVKTWISRGLGQLKECMDS